MTVLSKKAAVCGASAAAAAAAAVYCRWRVLASRASQRSCCGNTVSASCPSHSSKHREHVDAEFFRKLFKLIAVAVPGLWCQETGLCLFQLFLLIVRTFLSIKISTVNGSIVEAIVMGKFHLFLGRIATLASIAIPASTINSAIRYLGSRLAVRYRWRLVNKFHDEYFDSMCYYKVANLDSRISNPDQALTETIEKWGRSLSDLFSNVTKPLFDIVLFSAKLSQVVGSEGPLSVIAYYFVSGILIRLLSPRFGKLTAQAQRLEGKFRFCHTRLIAYGEEVSFYQGHQREKAIVNSKFNDVLEHSYDFMLKHFWMGIADTFLVKYGAVMVGYCVLGLPVFGPNSSKYREVVGSDTSAITRDYIANSSLLINLAQAIGRIVTSYKEMQRLAGYTSLVSNLQTVLDDLRHNRYVRKMVSQEDLQQKRLAPFQGKVVESDNIVFNGVPVVTPNGDILANDLNFEIRQGMNLMIVGPNGCGKSSLFRILGGLWPLFGGELKKPHQRSIFYVPQKPYLPLGTLRDQIIYPHSYQDMIAAGKSDTNLIAILETVKLKYIVDREGSFDKVDEWADVLSGGEKQRMAMARLFYHQPLFAILDECTSAVSVDVEGILYDECKERGISLITVSHRPSLWKYHDYKLTFDGRGGWSFGPMLIGEDFNHVP